MEFTRPIEQTYRVPGDPEPRRIRGSVDGDRIAHAFVRFVLHRAPRLVREFEYRMTAKEPIGRPLHERLDPKVKVRVERDCMVDRTLTQVSEEIITIRAARLFPSPRRGEGYDGRKWEQWKTELEEAFPEIPQEKMREWICARHTRHTLKSLIAFILAEMTGKTPGRAFDKELETVRGRNRLIRPE